MEIPDKGTPGAALSTGASRWGILADAARRELEENILPYWYGHTVDRENGGFFGFVGKDNRTDPRSAKGLVMHARLLWTYSAANRMGIGSKDKNSFAAGHALEFLQAHLADPVHGGYWWRCNSDGTPEDRNKVVYGQAFALYGLSEAIRNGESADLHHQADAIFTLLESQALDRIHGGYYEILTEDWEIHPEGRLSPVDIPCSKSMNTNLHVLEAYTNYCRIRPTGEVTVALEGLIRWFVSTIVDRSRGHLILFLDSQGRSMRDVDSYGHDIEAAWLLREAAAVLGDQKIKEEIEPALTALAESTLIEGISPSDGGLDYERDGDHRDTDRHWWVQAEALVGFRDRYEQDGDIRWLDASEGVWNFIEDHIIDNSNGEWLWGIKADGRPLDREKGGLWKTPYHNGRACMELIERIHGPLQGRDQ